MELVLFVIYVAVVAVAVGVMAYSLVLGEGDAFGPAIFVFVVAGLVPGGMYWAGKGFTASPERQVQRLETASGVPTFTITCPPGVWERTRNLHNVAFPQGPTDKKKADDAKAKPVKVTTAGGMATVVLSGTETVDYLKALDWHAHGARFAPVRDKDPVAARMYEALAKEIDKIKAKPGDTLPRNVAVTVNDGNDR